MRGSTLDLVMLWVSTTAQTMFVLLWLTQRWWATRVGRVLMFKSAMLAVLFLASLWVYYYGPIPTWLGRLLFGGITVAITAQFLTMLNEIRQARREHRPVSGTNGSHSER